MEASGRGRRWVFVGGILAACSSGETSDAGLFGSASSPVTSISTGDPGTDGEGNESSGDEAGSTSGAEETSSADSESMPSTSGGPTDGGDASSSSADSDESGGSDTSGGGDPGQACGGGGDMALPGGGGACNANQNCPQTDFVVQVANSPGAIVDVDVSLEAIAANTQQNRVWLIGPDSTQVLLFDQRGNAFTDDFVGTLFDDHGSTLVSAAPGPFHGCFKPEQSLAAFNGKSADGTWTLRVETCLYETSVSSWQLHLDF